MKRDRVRERQAGGTKAASRNLLSPRLARTFREQNLPRAARAGAIRFPPRNRVVAFTRFRLTWHMLCPLDGHGECSGQGFQHVPGEQSHEWTQREGRKRGEAIGPPTERADSALRRGREPGVSQVRHRQHPPGGRHHGLRVQDHRVQSQGGGAHGLHGRCGHRTTLSGDPEVRLVR